jgi:hypothetical protein
VEVWRRFLRQSAGCALNLLHDRSHGGEEARFIFVSLTHSLTLSVSITLSHFFRLGGRTGRQRRERGDIEEEQVER